MSGTARLRGYAGHAALTLIGLVVLWPVLWSGYSGDDMMNSQGPLVRRVAGVSFWSQVGDSIHEFLSKQGRFFPGSAVQGLGAFTLFGSRWSYKAFQVVIVLAVLLVFAVLIGRLCGDRRIGLFGGLLALTAFQLRPDWDPILQFSGLLPTIVLLFLLALLAFDRHLEDRRIAPLVVATVLYATALVTYEIVFFLAPAFVVLALRRGRPDRRTWRSVAIVIAPALVQFVLSLVLRTQASSLADNYALSLAPGPLLRTTLRQVLVNVPFVQSVAGTGAAPGPLRALGSWSGALVTLACLALGFVVIRRLPAVDRRTRGVLAVLGLLLWLAPAGVVGMTRLWQQRLAFGQGYLASFASGFGLAFVLVALAVRTTPGGRHGVEPRRPAALAVLLTLGAALACGVAARGNERVVAAVDRTVRDPRAAVEAAVAHGLFDDVADGSVVGAYDLPLWLTPELVADRTGATLRFQPASSPGGTHTLSFGATAAHTGWAALTTADGRTSVVVTDPELDAASAAADVEVVGRPQPWGDPAPLPTGSVRRVGGGRGWIAVEVTQRGWTPEPASVTAVAPRRDV